MKAKTKVDRSFNWFSLLIGILLIAASFIAFRNPKSDLVALVVFFGIAAVARGIIEVYLYFNHKNEVKSSLTGLLIMGILNIIFGIILLTNIYSGVLALPYVFAIWFIIDSIAGLIASISMKSVRGSYFWFSVVMNILGIIIGIMLFFNPILSALTLAFLVGTYFLITGIIYLVGAFNA